MKNIITTSRSIIQILYATRFNIVPCLKRMCLIWMIWMIIRI
ncbi:hypothetical protein vBEcoMWL3_gp195 [Escherichia phage vB_EcoM_WL-3]|nr:hypothetical protein vBEcoMWL3_gp195 [Escherichia phage vB_EcoM_WL-3]